MGSADLVLRNTSQAIDHISGICFKTGPPRRVGVELEWTTHRAGDPAAPVGADELRAALGVHTPATLGNPEPRPLPAGGTVTVEPGGQVEISSAPADSLTALHASVTTDHAALTALLARAGLVLGDRGLDEHREPRRILDTPRYAAMERSFDRAGRTMMTGTAGLQICLDAGEAGQVAERWAALHEFGPPLLALFANSRVHAGRDTGWASARMAAWYGIDPRRAGPVPGNNPARDWSRYALSAPLLCVRQDGDRWDAPPGMTFADWIEEHRPGRLGVRRIGSRRPRVGRPPTVADLDYHLNTLFPPVRPRGYLEVRYLDTQPGGEWIAPAAVVTTLLADPALTGRAREIAAPAAGRWRPAARAGLRDPAVRAAAAGLAELACRNLDRTGLPAAVREGISGVLQQRLQAEREVKGSTR
ncbi:glutamate--cysteine ligase EgtA [Actinoplanes ianthinogenes]|uniref:Glutamate--cysteine ligase EgtA n=1 Tax=Actinoplanes ianthinogenes TaxID=122358 RepID=A0ABN6C9S2_9ACTN|nr:ergothioneine biosynthesis glutamate--cysteine ligase EgtA [Actinoplanes ianthinogenes]BCJ41451.1 glutamate--cysteine ligase EgtA [Actinoplanes ianthinogenes]GGR30010.1 glutamate--cysteine ligase EgtA [Actinoplanes ianthinogenes]